MADQALYVPHTLGVVVGSAERRPWIAADLDTATALPWRGQPVFAIAADAFDWVDWASEQPWLPSGMAIAHVNTRTDVTAEGMTRVHVGSRHLRDPASQVLRAHAAAAGPHERVLAGCYATARTDAARAWLIDQAGADAKHRTDAATTAVWTYGYHIAARDARTAYAGHVARSVAATQTTQSTSDEKRQGGGELGRLADAAATLAAGAAFVHVVDLPSAVRAHAREGLRRGGELTGWDEALNVVWQQALRAGVLDATVGAASDIETLWRDGDHDYVRTARIGGRSADRWVSAAIADANRAVVSAWLVVTARLLPPAPSYPRAAATPTPPVPDHNPKATPNPSPPSSTESAARRAFPPFPAVSVEAPGENRSQVVPPGSPGRRR